MHRFKLLLILLMALAPHSKGLAQDAGLQAEIDKLLEAVGGRELWANATPALKCPRCFIRISANCR